MTTVTFSRTLSLEERSLSLHCLFANKLHLLSTQCTANPTWGDIFKCFFKAQSSKLERLFSLKRGKRDVRALRAFENVTPGGIGCTFFVLFRLPSTLP